MTSEERKELLWNLEKLEDALQAIIRDIRNERNKIILEQEEETNE